MTHLEVKSDGLIYLIKDCPEEYFSKGCHCELQCESESLTFSEQFCGCYNNYQSALASCERILVAGQEQARDLIFKPGLRVIIDKDFSNGGEVTLLEWAKLYAKVKDDSESWETMKYRLTIKPGIYSIPNVEFTINAECHTWCSDCEYFDWSTCRDKYIAILKESTPSTEQESQEELWFDVARTMDAHSEMHRIPILIKQFTITRKK